MHTQLLHKSKVMSIIKSIISFSIASGDVITLMKRGRQKMRRHRVMMLSAHFSARTQCIPLTTLLAVKSTHSIEQSAHIRTLT